MNVAELADSLLKIPGLRKMMQLLSTCYLFYGPGYRVGLKGGMGQCSESSIRVRQDIC